MRNAHEASNLHLAPAVGKPDFDRIAELLKELEDMCSRAKELRAELEAARSEGRFWRHAQDVKRPFSLDEILAEAADN